MLYSYFWVIAQLLNFLGWHFRSLFHLHRAFKQHMKMEQTECSKILEQKIRTSGNLPKERIEHPQNGGSLKSNYHIVVLIGV